MIWQLMDTAPKDGTRFLAVQKAEDEWPAEIHIIQWGTEEPYGETGWTTDSHGPGYSESFDENELSHWMALPPIPENELTSTNG